MIIKKHIPVVKPYLPNKEKYFAYLDKLWDSRWLTNKGKYHSDYIKKIKNYLDVPYVYPFLNGTTALETAIKILGIKNKEIITTPFTFVATTLAIINTGNIPVFCDIDVETGNIDTNKIKRCITKKTAAILPVHIYGEPVDIIELEKIAIETDNYLIVDSAHCFGVKLDGIGIGNFGNMNIFSTHATKLFHTIEGGLLSYNNPDIDRIVNLSTNFGLQENYDLIYPGTNGKMNEFQCAMGLCMLDEINTIIDKRKKLVDIYLNLLNDSIIFTKYSNDRVTYNYNYFIIKHPQRDKIMNNLIRKNITTRAYFYPLCSNYTLVKKMFGKSNLPVAEFVSKDVLALPLYPELSKDEINFICDQINKIK